MGGWCEEGCGEHCCGLLELPITKLVWASANNGTITSLLLRHIQFVLLYTAHFPLAQPA